jgi:dethiobiotin synthetase
MMRPLFITGIGTDVGKTLVAAILAEALQADYWKPVQAGFSEGTDSEWVKEMTGGSGERVHPELYRLSMAASPHIAAREEGVQISLDRIVERYGQIGAGSAPLIIEGAGGLLVPLNDREFVVDLVKKLDATVILVSRNYLGSINHSLLTAAVCKAHGLRVGGWIFNDQYLHYEEEIAAWTGIPVLASVPRTERPDKVFVRAQAERIRPLLQSLTG